MGGRAVPNFLKATFVSHAGHLIATQKAVPLQAMLT